MAKLGVARTGVDLRVEFLLPRRQFRPNGVDLKDTDQGQSVIADDFLLDVQNRDVTRNLQLLAGNNFSSPFPQPVPVNEPVPPSDGQQQNRVLQKQNLQLKGRNSPSGCLSSGSCLILITCEAVVICRTGAAPAAAL